MISGKNSNSDAHQLWAGRASGKTNSIAMQMGESISLDIELYQEDIIGSKAHSKMLHKIGILSDRELSDIQNGLDQIKSEIESGDFKISIEKEDIHTHIETRLVELIGDAGKKLHTARSRNDQIALDTHLFIQKASRQTIQSIIELLDAFLDQARVNIDTILPGYTHMQVAQPIRLAHHLLAHFWSFEKDLTRLEAALQQASKMPLGCGAMAGVNYDNDREYLRVELGFASITPNSMDSVATRDHILDYLYACSTTMIHASRICEEIIIWNSIEFGFLSLPDELTTGSSIMPQKKNPDLAELIRGKTGRVLSNLSNVLINLKSLPLTYNRDLQEDRLPMLDTYKQIILSIKALGLMVKQAQFHPEKMTLSLDKGFATATDLADALVLQKKVSFRDAHHLVGKLVAYCVENGLLLHQVNASQRKNISLHFEEEIFYKEAIDLKSSADRKISYGGTAKVRVREQLELATQTLLDWKTKHPEPKEN